MGSKYSYTGRASTLNLQASPLVKWLKRAQSTSVFVRFLQLSPVRLEEPFGGPFRFMV